MHVRYLNGPFRYLNNHWRFQPARRRAPRSISSSISSSARRLLQAAIGVVFNEAVRLMVRSFERRAMQLYGRPAAPPAGAAPAPQA